MHQYELVKTIMIVFAVLYFFIEILLNLNDIDQDTSNAILLEWAKGKLFIIPFALGAIGGHLFLGTANSAFKMSSSIYPVLILFSTAIVSIIIGNKVQFSKTRLLFSILLVLGLVYGHLFWSMNYVIK